jgi:hypothetical protein
VVFSEVIGRSILADGEKPWCEAILIQRGQGLAQPDENILHDVPRIIQLTHVVLCVADERLFIALKGFTEELVGV